MNCRAVRLTEENATRLQAVARMIQADPEAIVNDYLLDELKGFADAPTSSARLCAMQMLYTDQKTALAVARRLNAFAWKAGLHSEPLIVEQDENGNWRIGERDFDGIKE